MEPNRERGPDFGTIVRQHRESRGFDIDGLCAAIGGTPGIGFLASLEAGSVGPSSSLVLKLAEALALPPDLMLNAAGFATQGQRNLALETLAPGEALRRAPGPGSPGWVPQRRRDGPTILARYWPSRAFDPGHRGTDSWIGTVWAMPSCPPDHLATARNGTPPRVI